MKSIDHEDKVSSPVPEKFSQLRLVRWNLFITEVNLCFSFGSSLSVNVGK